MYMKRPNSSLLHELGLDLQANGKVTFVWVITWLLILLS
jgi:hypothetical protein